MTLDVEDKDYSYLVDSDDEGGDEEHKRLLSAISKLDKRKRVLPSERKEPSLQVSEFHLTKESSDQNTVHLGELAKSLRLKSSHVEIARNLKAAQKKAKTLPRPLEKPAAERIRRGVGYDNVKEQVTKWDPVVFRQRVSDNLQFPLKPATPIHVDYEDFLSRDQTATELERQMAEVLNGSSAVQKEREEEEEEFPLSIEEMIERRKELAKFRAQESYRQAKARRQNKIKSKKFHRYARRERIREQIKEFEELQQKDPEAALERLEQIEKERALERASLRHRSTGAWAKNQAVRAKYDKESRQVLAEQLRFSKQLTQKVQVESESSDEGELEAESNIPSTDNPWMSQPKTEEEVDSFLSGYRKYWMEKTQKAPEESDLKEDEQKTLQEPPVLDSKQKALLESAVVSHSEIYENVEDNSSKPLELKSKVNGVSKKEKQKMKAITTPTDKKPTAISSGGKWVVTPLECPSTPKVSSIIDMFENLSDKMARKIGQKIDCLKGELVSQEPSEHNEEKRKGATTKRKEKSSNPPEFKRQKVQIDLDEELDEGRGDERSSNANDFIKLVKENAKTVATGEAVAQKPASATELDPNKFMKARSVKLNTELPDEITGGDEGLDDSDNEGGEKEKMMTISEAFADDDVVADFDQEKNNAVDKSKPEDINLHLPGWGSWGGHNIKPNKRKKSRFMVKMPEAPPRRDENKGNLYINEAEDSNARAHQVSELPFPFTRVKDFEANLRAPIGNTFIPESAHRKLIKPPIVTKMGRIIEPMEKEVLVKRDENAKRKKRK
ncbi:hypothetical protein ONE63_003091 [Megalurothrips usitatus]|nr:hypothetical protein ONE63_003091 [Megalurothrips usitatus]